MKVFVILKKDFEAGTDGHEWKQNTTVVGVRLTEKEAKVVVAKEYGKEDPGDSDLTYEYYYEEHEAPEISYV